MRKKFILSVVLLLLTLPCMSASTIKNLSVVKYITVSIGNDPTENEDLTEKRRIPSYAVQCIIDESKGVELHGEGDVEIIAYEIWQSGVGCTATFEDEEDFLKIIFTLKGEYEIHFETANCTYIGKIVL
ncbi:MAG: hypothetical protein HDS12_06170 [Bacteroides sp.]|nr:hypothetical protein [Bacteroides sp.]MBD5348913.1 hypothetical protein [Bacteroides sp.]